MDKKASTEELTEEENVDRARLLSNLRTPEEALPTIREVVAKYPANAQANYLLGDTLLDEDDEAGIAHIEAAMNEEPDAQVAGSAAIRNFLIRHGRHAEARGFEEKLYERADLESEWQRDPAD